MLQSLINSSASKVLGLFINHNEKGFVLIRNTKSSTGNFEEKVVCVLHPTPHNTTDGILQDLMDQAKIACPNEHITISAPLKYLACENSF